MYIANHTPERTMTQATFTFRVDDDLKAAFAAAAKDQERTAAQLLRLLMRGAVERRQEAREHDAWFRGEVERAMGEADDGAVGRIPHEDIESRWRQQRAELVKRAGGENG
jgi:predicted transcriptional regulator